MMNDLTVTSVTADQFLQLAKAWRSTEIPAANIWLHGKPGVGKTSVTQMLPKVCEHPVEPGKPIPFIGFRGTDKEPVDLSGVPSVVDAKTFWNDPSWLPTEEHGVFFIDELAQCNAAMQTALMKLIDEKIPKSWMVVAASNRIEDKAGAGRIITPQLNRFTHLDFVVDAECWCSWAVPAGIHGDVVSWIRNKPEVLCQFNPLLNLKAFPTPRSWERVSRIISVTPEDLMLAAVAGTIGEGYAIEFLQWRQRYKELPDVDFVLQNPGTATVPTEASIIYLLEASIIDRLRTAPLDKVQAGVQYCMRFPADFAAMFARDLIGSRPEAIAVPQMQEWCGRNSDVLRSLRS